MTEPSADVDAALGADVSDRAGLLLALREGQWFDRKSARIHPRKLAESLVAMANADGGFIVVGLHNGVVEDVVWQGEQLNALQQASRDFCQPPVKLRGGAELVEVVDAQGQPAAVL